MRWMSNILLHQYFVKIPGQVSLEHSGTLETRNAEDLCHGLRHFRGRCLHEVQLRPYLEHGPFCFVTELILVLQGHP